MAASALSPAPPPESICRISLALWSFSIPGRVCCCDEVGPAPARGYGGEGSNDCSGASKPCISCRSWASVGCVIDGIRLGKCWATSSSWGSGMEDKDLAVVPPVPLPWTVGVGLSCGEDGSACTEQISFCGWNRDSNKLVGITADGETFAYYLPFRMPPATPVILFSLDTPPSLILASRRSFRSRACSVIRCAVVSCSDVACSIIFSACS